MRWVRLTVLVFGVALDACGDHAATVVAPSGVTVRSNVACGTELRTWPEEKATTSRGRWGAGSPMTVFQASYRCPTARRSTRRRARLRGSRGSIRQGRFGSRSKTLTERTRTSGGRSSTASTPSAMRRSSTARTTSKSSGLSVFHLTWRTRCCADVLPRRCRPRRRARGRHRRRTRACGKCHASLSRRDVARGIRSRRASPSEVLGRRPVPRACGLVPVRTTEAAQPHADVRRQLANSNANGVLEAWKSALLQATSGSITRASSCSSTANIMASINSRTTSTTSFMGLRGFDCERESLQVDCRPRQSNLTTTSSAVGYGFKVTYGDSGQRFFGISKRLSLRGSRPRPRTNSNRAPTRP